MINKICGIYGIFDKSTNDCLYIGQSKDVFSRFKSHLKLLNGGYHLRKDFVAWFVTNNSDKENLVFKVLEECIENDLILNTLEIKWFEYYLPKFYGSVPSKNNTWNHSQETKEKISYTLKSTKSSFLDRELICKYCNNIFHSRRKEAVYCSQTCNGLSKVLILNELEQKICQSYIDGKSLRECEKIYNISYVKIRSILISNNIKRRSN